MNAKNTLRALITSFLALILCLSMLVGTTYAWFTDSVTTGVNTIQSGSLDVDMVDKDGKSLAGRTLAFRNEGGRDDILWEPGAKFALDAFQVVNKGNLALKYQIFINGLTGNSELLDVITFTVKVGDANEITLADFNTNFGEGADNHLSPAGNTEGKDKSSLITIYGEMDPNADNKYQDMILDGISITVYATQYTAESDSFGNQYDAAATYLNQDENGNWLISNAAELLYFAKTVNSGKTYKGETLKLTADIDMTNVVWTPITGFGGTFDGNGHTISNFSLASATSAGFFGGINTTATIQNVTFDKASVSGTHYVAVVLGWEGNETVNATIKGVKVTNSKVVCDTDPKPDNGDKAGFIVGYAVTLNIEGCSVDNGTIIGYRDVGGILGCANGSGIVLKDNKVTNVTMLRDKDVNYNNITTNEGHNFGAIVGRNNKGITVDDTNTYSNVTIGDLVGVKTAAELKDALNTVNSGDAVYLASDIKANEPLVVEQPTDKEQKIVIDGNGFKFEGSLFIRGNSSPDTDSLTVRNVNFVIDSGTDAAIDSYWGVSNENRYAHNVTIENCTFTMTGAAKHVVVAIDLYQPYNVVVRNCTVTGAHSVLQNKGGHDGILVEGVTAVDCKNGISFGTAEKATVKNCNIESVGVGGYGIRVDGNTAGAYDLAVENTTIKAFIPVLARKITVGTNYNIKMSGTNALTATNAFGYQIVLSAGDWDDDGAQPVAPTGVYTLTGANGFKIFK